ncbi:hypothetical protein PHSY_000078 [Pseudozyma hubeiensis SY62]|uniref:Uncharacterized protein n=1 Tax=Pseudozyma hubeiensis (strain SY62) TaxID=1305764 RepID=R9NVM8_PSEHS|nr:hypothetical protein PHSY_000078 [Pseudozyma hubeiensis SY62]GAC92524.1 hypothetical protein PHSY_000078 [Pseudozyma hubeiensis SY62]
MDAGVLASPLEKRMNGRGDQLPFDDLHVGFFRHRPFPSPPLTVDAEEMYPETYFFQQRPVFFTDSANLLNRDKLHEAYSLWGKIHVVDTDGPRFLTILPDTRRPADALGRYTHDEGLEKYVEKVQAIERLYGRSIAHVAFGPVILRRPSDVPDRERRYPELVLWRDIRNAAPLPFNHGLNSGQLRDILKRDKFVKISSQDGLSSFVLRFDVDGTLHNGLLGDMDPELLDFF